MQDITQEHFYHNYLAKTKMTLLLAWKLLSMTVSMFDSARKITYKEINPSLTVHDVYKSKESGMTTEWLSVVSVCHPTG